MPYQASSPVGTPLFAALEQAMASLTKRLPSGVRPFDSSSCTYLAMSAELDQAPPAGRKEHDQVIKIVRHLDHMAVDVEAVRPRPVAALTHFEVEGRVVHAERVEDPRPCMAWS